MKKKSKLFGASIGIILAGLGLTNKNEETSKIQPQNQAIYNSIENSFKTHNFPDQPTVAIGDYKKNYQGINYEKLFENRRLNHNLIPDAISDPTNQELDDLEKIQNLNLKQIILRLNIIKDSIKKKIEITKDEEKFLTNYVSSFENQNRKFTFYENNAIYFLAKIKTIKSNFELRNSAREFIKNYKYKIDPNLLLNNVRNKKTIKIQGGTPIVNFSQINENLAVNVFRLCNKYKVNLKLVYSILLIENNFGKTNTSSVGAQGISQVMPQFLKQIYGNKKLSEWDKFVAIFPYLKSIEKELNIDISDLYKINEVDLILAANGYFDGVTNMHKNTSKIYSKNDIGLNYAKKILVSIFSIKFEIPIDFEKQKDNRFRVINSKLI